MKIKTYILIVIILNLFLVSITSQVRANSTSIKEYQVKAAFLYSFINFVDWPENKLSQDQDTIIIGIIGNDPFGKAFEPIKDKQVKNKDVVIKRFKSFNELSESDDEYQAVTKCHLLYICPSEKDELQKILKLAMNHNILTVGDMKSFLESGGIINFLMEDKKVRFEINNATAEEAELQIRSKLLRLAKRIIQSKPSDERKS
jgi:hypothetical protein